MINQSIYSLFNINIKNRITNIEVKILIDEIKSVFEYFKVNFSFLKSDTFLYLNNIKNFLYILKLD